MSKGICLVDYLGCIDDQANPIGHVIKCVKEFSTLLKNDISLSVAVAECYKDHMESGEIKRFLWLNGHMQVTKKTFWVKVKNLVNRVRNIWKVMRSTYKDDILWFVSTDYVLFLFLLLFPVKDRRIWVICYFQQCDMQENLLKKWLKNFLLGCGVKKVEKVIVSNPNLNFGPKSVYMADYLYDPDFYGRYEVGEKKRQAICLGIMGPGKDIEELVRVFKRIDMPLKIIGKFLDDHLFDKIQSEVTPNIIIENRYITDEDEYYGLIAESMFVVLPYKKEHYHMRTSGILQEAVFLDCILVAPAYLLEFHQVQGIGYKNLDELPNMLKIDAKNDLPNNRDLKQECYVELVRNRILGWL